MVGNDPMDYGQSAVDFYERLVADVAARVIEMMVAPEPSLLVSPSEAAKMLSVSPRTVNRMVVTGKLKEVNLQELNGKRNRLRRMRRADVEEILRSRAG